jgi:hypothetical protein
MFDDDSTVIEAEIVHKPVDVPTKVANAQEEALNKAREKLNRYLGRAVEIITELAETSENDRVRLAAAESIADRAGLGKSSTTQVNVSASEHEAARREAEELVGRLSDQKSVGKAPVVDPDLDTLIVLEGEVVDNPA